ncbi:uncharacterized protein LOC114871931 [Osmia bicornis bicornis]|uniref:uncharacterized protein LOC114871931 n=1 Tax=Osmia bicornis bicornis TaxID=1437191 RepID=UPI001EAEA68F|nr:uncharacterized protein LOC114871931 [Osmia bicornis bicornis]
MKYLVFRRKSEYESKILPNENIIKRTTPKREEEIEDIWASMPRDSETKLIRRTEDSPKIISETREDNSRVNTKYSPVTHESHEKPNVKDDLPSERIGRDESTLLHEPRPSTRKPVKDVEVESESSKCQKKVISNGEDTLISKFNSQSYKSDDEIEVVYLCYSRYI